MSREKGSADLTPLQRKYLRNLAEFCRSPPTFWRLCRKMVPNHLFLIGIFGLFIYVCVAREQFPMAWALGGALGGVLLRDFDLLRQRVHLWPASDAIIDRERLAELTHEPTAAEWSDRGID
ncbi:MAG TPA: hypothetical protein VGI99_09550 [Gemmataceae bacterium]|jgi:hypothetical protein